ncbi:MAG: hypothetical protein MI757_22560 [Pirellulales bacterium]|nr:hypothetical protein [Pirellulales bacterium]
MQRTTRMILAATIAASTITITSAKADAVTLIDYTFGGSNTGPAVQVVDNGTDTAVSGSANTGSGVIITGNSGTSGSGNTHNIGFNSSGLVDTTSFSQFTATFEIESISLTGNVANLSFNGLFFGVVSGTNATGTGGASLWRNDPMSFGYLPGSGSWGDHVMAENQATITTTGLTTTQPTNDSLIDGFTVSITLFDDDTWQVSSNGLSTELNQSGALPNLTYADFANVGIYVSLQGQAGAQIDMGRMTLSTVVIPEPSSAMIVVLGIVCCAALRRNKSRTRKQ